MDFARQRFLEGARDTPRARRHSQKNFDGFPAWSASCREFLALSYKLERKKNLGFFHQPRNLIPCRRDWRMGSCALGFPGNCWSKWRYLATSESASLQRRAKSKNKIPATRLKRSTPPSRRSNSDVGAAGMGPGGRLGGTGGSRIPMPVNLRGGPPERLEEDAGSSSNSFSANSYGIEKMLLP